MSFITFVIGVGVGVLAEKALDLSSRAYRYFEAVRSWPTFRKP